MYAQSSSKFENIYNTTVQFIRLRLGNMAAVNSLQGRQQA